MFFEWSLFCLKHLQENSKRGLIGCSFYTPIVNEIGPAPNPWSPPKWNSSSVIGSTNQVFYFQLPCSWGAMYSSKYWAEFLEYYWCRKYLDELPELPDTRSNEWFKSWKRYPYIIL